MRDGGSRTTQTHWARAHLHLVSAIARFRVTRERLEGCAGFPRHKSSTDTLSVRRAQVAIRSARFRDTREASAGRKDRPEVCRRRGAFVSPMHSRLAYRNRPTGPSPLQGDLPSLNSRNRPGPRRQHRVCLLGERLCRGNGQHVLPSLRRHPRTWSKITPPYLQYPSTFCDTVRKLPSEPIQASTSTTNQEPGCPASWPITTPSAKLPDDLSLEG